MIAERAIPWNCWINSLRMEFQKSFFPSQSLSFWTLNLINVQVFTWDKQEPLVWGASRKGWVIWREPCIWELILDWWSWVLIKSQRSPSTRSDSHLLRCFHLGPGWCSLGKESAIGSSAGCQGRWCWGSLTRWCSQCLRLVPISCSVTWSQRGRWAASTPWWWRID